MNVGERLRALRLVARFEPYDVSTEEGRARERHRRAFWITATSFLSRGLAAAVSVITVPLTLGYLGKQQYGMWMALSSLLTWMALADFGLARGLQNHLAEAYGNDDSDSAGRHMSTAFFALGSIAAVIATLLVPALVLVPWERLLEVTEPALIRELRPTLAAVMVVFLAQFPLNVVGQAYAAYQRTHISNLFGIAGSVLSIVLLLVVIHLRLGLPWLIVASGGLTVALTIVNFGYLLRDMPALRPRLAHVTRATLGELMSVSTPMLLFQIGALLINEAQIVLIARCLGLSAVTDWSVFMRVFQVPVLVVAMIESPYAPMLREAFVRGDEPWFRRTFFGLLKIKVLLTLVGAALYLLAGDPVAGLLSGSSVSFGWRVWALGGLLLVVGCWNGTYTVLFMAVNRLWILVATVLANGAVTLWLTWALAARGMTGLVMAYVAFSVVITAWLMPILSRSVFREAAARAEEKRQLSASEESGESLALGVDAPSVDAIERDRHVRETA